MIKVTVCGACGETGRRLIELISQDKELKLMFAIEEKNHHRIGKTINIGDHVVMDNLGEIINETDVVVDFGDFSKTGLEHLATAAYDGKAIIIGNANTKNSILPEINAIKYLIDGRIPCVIVSPITTNKGIPASPSCIRDVIAAIKWIVGKPAKLYDMQDILAAECFRN
ncbi:MAG: hypothetical protein Q8N22_01915 [bacterium]|nr:hypothetical protein [bacterium]